MWKRFAQQARLYWKDSLGFALFLGWVYCTLFGCSIAEPYMPFYGLPSDYSLEKIWLWNGVAEALGGAAVLVLAGIARACGTKLDPRPARFAALGCAIAGSVVIWAAWYGRIDFFPTLHAPGGFLAGMGAALFTMAWGRRLGSSDEASIEFSVPYAFTLAFAAYLIILLFRPSSLINLALVCLMCVGSCMLLAPPAASSAEPGCAPVPDAAKTSVQAPLNDLASFGTLMAASWIQIAYFRVISTPAFMGDRFTHYLFPFLAACITSCAMLLLCLLISRYLNLSLVYRWGLPLFVLAYVPLLLDYNNATLRMIGCGISLLGMFGVQFGCWLGAGKYVRRMRCSPAGVFGTLALGEGLGIAVGCLAGLFAVGLPHNTLTAALSLLLLGLVQLAAMAAGFNPNWVFRRTHDVGVSLPPARATAAAGIAAGTHAQGAPAQAVPTPAPTLDELFHREALALQKAFGLTNRETEVAELLLAGRSRPFIRDRLFVSLNTVGVHVRSIFGKCDVHSQQELIDLARDGLPACEP